MDSFEVSRRQKNEVEILEIKGYLDAHTAPSLENAIQELIDSDTYQIVINFRDLAYISSAGLGVLMGFIENIREHGGDIKLCEMNEKIYRVFDLLGFPKIYDITEKEEDAVQKFNR
ncbi:anti-anti-sigma factor [candidate division KSB1 bacterium 4484_87]|nr:MAG: anti-anti-sigma factor [candidate division KSB1 bacterium 4484_87]